MTSSTDDSGMTSREKRILESRLLLHRMWSLAGEAEKTACHSLVTLESPWNSSTANENIHLVYQTLEGIGEGYIGKVTKARLKVYPKMMYAIKTIKKSSSVDKNFKYFKTEVDLLKEVDHPNIAKFFECYQDQQNFYMVLELCEGPDLVKVVEEHKGLSEPLVKRFFFQALLAVNYLHQVGIVHRDIKLDNFLLTSKDVDKSSIRLIDFGFAKKFREGQLTSQVGTPWYVAPEILDKGKPYTQACDNWSLGVMLYIMLFAEAPFKGRSNSEIFQQVREKIIDYTDPRHSSLSADLVVLLTRLLIKDPTQRITLGDALQSPWFNVVIKEMHYAWDSSAIKKIVKKLKAVRCHNKFKREVIKIMVKIFHDTNEVKALTNSFYCCDYMANGVITAMELEHLFKEVQVPCTPAEISSIIDSLFLRTEKVITYSEFIAGTVSSSFFTEYHRLKLTFDRFDIDKSGYVTEQNIRGCFERFGYGLNESTVKSFICEFDIDRDGVISFEEFCKMMKK